MLTRDKLRSVLVDWQAGGLEPLEVLEWAEAEVELEPSSDVIIQAILSRLDILHVNLITVEDVPAFLEALDLPVEQSAKALLILERHEKCVDWEARKDRYQNHPPYSPME